MPTCPDCNVKHTGEFGGEIYWGGRIIKFGFAKFDYFSTPNDAGEGSNPERI